MLIRISQRFRYDMTPVELYDATRGIWVLGKRRENARFALAVFEGVVQEVYEIKRWFEAGETFSTREENLGGSDRWEFVGQIAPERIRKKYLGKDVRRYFKNGNRSPIKYENVPE